VNCEIRRNLCGGTPSSEGGAGAWLRLQSRFINCVFNANDSWARGGAVFVNPGIDASFTNCAFTNNITIADNGGAITGIATIANSILWDNSPAELNGTFDATHSCVEGGAAGIGNTSSNPQFIDANGADGVPGTSDDDLRLLPTSPCIDAADNLALPADAFDVDGDGNLLEPMPLDLERRVRRVNDPRSPDSGNPGWPGAAIVDMGAYEFRDIQRVEGDVTGDGVVDADDFVAVILAWGVCVDPLNCPADVTPLGGDGLVNADDLIAVIALWSM
jgi:hypothetical protein